MSDSTYTGKLRVRVAGILIEDGKLLLVKLHSPVSNSDIWMPPGGGVEFGESLHDALKREFKEETGLGIKVGSLASINELLEPPFHAIEFYFFVEKIDGKLELGSDPEHSSDTQLLKEVQFFNVEALSSVPLKPSFLRGIIFKKKSSEKIDISLKFGE